MVSADFAVSLCFHSLLEMSHFYSFLPRNDFCPGLYSMSRAKVGTGREWLAEWCDGQVGDTDPASRRGRKDGNPRGVKS